MALSLISLFLEYHLISVTVHREQRYLKTHQLFVRPMTHITYHLGQRPVPQDAVCLVENDFVSGPGLLYNQPLEENKSGEGLLS